MNLTRREKAIIELLKLGMLNKQMAWELGITEGTIKQYLYVLYKKAGASNRTDLVAKLYRGDL